MTKYWFVSTAFVVALAFVTEISAADKKYPPGVTETEIKIGQTMPYSGPLSVYGVIGRTEAVYLQMINEQGGISGRKLRLISHDDGYSPPKTVEMTRKLVEEEGVAFLWASIGTPTNASVQKYLNDRHVPQLMISSGASRFNDPEHFPWTAGGLLSYQTEARVYGKYILESKPAAKIGVLYQNDDLGRDYLKGLMEGLGAKAKAMILKDASYEVSDPTVDTQIAILRDSGADTFVNTAQGKFAAQAIRKVSDLGWKPLHLISANSSSIEAFLKPAGLDKSVGLITAIYFKDPTDPQWKDDQGVKDYLAWLKKYEPGANPSVSAVGYAFAQRLVLVLERCGDDLSGENLMKQAADLHDVEFPMLLPGIKVNTSTKDYVGINQLRLARFNGETWQLFGELIDSRVAD